jgi:Family of unknown function (DUF6535)
VTVLDLKPNSQDTSAFYLQNIYQLQLLADSNVSRSSIPVTPAIPPPFSPPKYVIWVNSLWFLSLVISLTCAMLATLVQQWARRYLRITHREPSSPHDGARIRAFFAHGVENLGFSRVVETIPTLIHISLFLFFAGLLIYLFNVNHTVFCAVVWWIAMSVATYMLITFMPILRLDSPYYVPLSSLAFRVHAGILGPAFLMLGWFSWFSSRASEHFFGLSDQCFKRCTRGLEKVAEEIVRKSSAEIDDLVLKWTFDAHSFASDDQLDLFFEYIHGFYNSNQIVRDPLRRLATLGSRKFSSAVVAFLKRTLTSNLVTESDKIQRFIMCVNIVDETQGPALRDLFSEAENYSFLRTVEVGRILRSSNRTGEEIGLCAQTFVSDIIAKVEERDDSWVELAADQLGTSEDDIRRYLAHGSDNVSLATWIHMARQISSSSSRIDHGMARDATSCALRLPSTFDIRNALPELQHDFCSLWNEIVPKAHKNGDGSVPHFIIFLLRSLYEDLHQGTDDALAPSFDRFKVSSYPWCNNPHHRSQETAAIPMSPLFSTHTTPHHPDSSSTSIGR